MNELTLCNLPEVIESAICRATNTQELTVSELIWRAAGQPLALSDERGGKCRLCGAVSAGEAFSRWVKDSFTNWGLLYEGAIICRACLFCAEEKSCLLQEMTGRDKPQKMRTYSHFVVDGEWRALTKGEKREMRRLLALEPDVAVISVTGQKHLLFRARAGWWQFEETALLPCWEKVRGWLTVIDELLTGDFSKTEVETGRYLPHRVARFGLERWRELEARVKEGRLSIAFDIALFLGQGLENIDDSRETNSQRKHSI
jgi:hypothetical protein